MDRSVSPLADGLSQVDEKDGQPLGLPLHLGDRCRPGQQQHQLRVPHARDPHLLAVDDVAVALAYRRGPELGGIAARGRLGDCHRLQPQLATRDLGQVFALLCFAAVTHQHVHDVHLAVTGAGIAAGTVDLLHDDRGLGQRQPGATVFLRNQRRQPAGLGQRVDEFDRIAALGVDLAKILVRKLRAQRAHAGANLFVIVG